MRSMQCQLGNLGTISAFALKTQGNQDKQINDLYCSPSFVRVITWRRMRWVGHVARMGDRRDPGFWCGNLKERDHLADPDLDGRIILSWIFMI
jgi:hypothetical protein